MPMMKKKTSRILVFLMVSILLSTALFAETLVGNLGVLPALTDISRLR